MLAVALFLCVLVCVGFLDAVIVAALAFFTGPVIAAAVYGVGFVVINAPRFRA